MGSMENRYGLVPPQTGRRKRHAEDGTLGGRYTEVKRNADNAQWDDSQKRILFRVGSAPRTPPPSVYHNTPPPVDHVDKEK